MLNRRKRVYSFWNKNVPQLSLHFKQYKIVEARRLTPIVMRQLGSRLVIIDELTKQLEHCGDLVQTPHLRLCAYNKDATPEPKAPAVLGLQPTAAPKSAEPKPEPTPEPTPEPEVAPEPVVEPEAAAPEAVEAPAEEEAPKPTRKKTTRRSSKKGTTKKASTKKAEAPAEEPKAEDLNPFADSE